MRRRAQSHPSSSSIRYHYIRCCETAKATRTCLACHRQSTRPSPSCNSATNTPYWVSYFTASTLISCCCYTAPFSLSKSRSAILALPNSSIRTNCKRCCFRSLPTVKRRHRAIDMRHRRAIHCCARCSRHGKPCHRRTITISNLATRLRPIRDATRSNMEQTIYRDSCRGQTPDRHRVLRRLVWEV